MELRRQSGSGVVLMLLLFAVYTACAMLLCVLGANAYQQTVATMQRDYSDRTGVLYIAQKVHQNDIGGALRLDSLNGAPALVLVEQDTGLAYETWIFVNDEALCELLIASGEQPIIAAAQSIMPMRSMDLALSSSGLLSVALVDGAGELSSIDLALRSSGGSFNTGGNAAPISPDLPSDDSAAFGPTIMTPAPAAAAAPQDQPSASTQDAQS